MTSSILLCVCFHCPRDSDRGSSFSALLKLVTDWSLVFCERSLRTEDEILICFSFCCICTVQTYVMGGKLMSVIFL